MKISETLIKGLYLLDYLSFTDTRGEFIKTIHASIFEEHGLDYKFDESFYSISNKNVIRGMHFQIPPDEHSKLVYLISGRIIDVVLDIRKESETYGKFFHTELSSDKRKGLYIGKGLAHGFIALEDNSIVEYHTTTVHSAINETGILFNSFGFNWNLSNPILSERDMNFTPFKNFKSPF
jgi:dTDP-4-dehydrorhamnose 3,5-epimerase/CDP-3, 6-dideoxy-D-glycero-D-glycero-4-hexulose-5-epimerase